LREERLDEDAIEQRVREVLRFVEMEPAIFKMPAELSGGMRRRVAIARAIASEPSIMLYDSPTGGLDPVTSQTINRLILKLRDVQKVSSIVVTHRLQDAYFLANYTYSPKAEDIVPLGSNGGRRVAGLTRFVILREGSVYFQGTEQDLVGSSDPYLRKFIV
jgi:phospholipid/cholesterol/gamma-HCH transport system ATP-binding protein